MLAFAMGVPVGYFSGDNLRLLEDAQILKPVYFISVPRVLNRVYAGVSAALAGGGLKATLLQKAIDAKLNLLRTTGGRDHLLWDRLVFKKVRSRCRGVDSYSRVYHLDSGPVRWQCEDDWLWLCSNCPRGP
jgi:long-chain acyl-CoA synthetase